MVEVLVALGVLMVGFLGMISVLGTGHGNISQNGRDTTAGVAAQSLVENMRNQPATDWALLNGMTSSDPSLCPGAAGTRLNTLCQNWIAAVAQLPQGQGTVAVVQTANPLTGIAMRTATVTVTWAEAARGGSRQFALVAGRSD